VGLEISGKRDQERRAEIDDVGPPLEFRRAGEVQLPVADIGHEHEPETADKCRERPRIDLRRVAQGGRGDAEQEHEVADRVAKGERGGQGVRVQRREDGSKERVPDNDAAADDHDQRVDREPEGIAPGGGRALEHQEGGDDDRVVGDVGSVRHRGGGCSAAKVQPGKCPVANGVDEHRDAHHDPAEANPPVVDAQRRPKDDHRSQQVQAGLADIGNGTLCARVPEAEDEPGDHDAPAGDREGKKDSVDRDAAALSLGRLGTGGVWRPCTFCHTDEPAGWHVEGASHGRCRTSRSGPGRGGRQDPSTVPVPRECEQAP